MLQRGVKRNVLQNKINTKKLKPGCCPDSERLAKQLSKKISASFELTGKPQWENFCLANRSLTGHGPGLVASYDIWPGNREGLFLFRCFINLSLTYLLRHLPTYLCRVPECSEVGISEFQLVNRSCELVNSQFELRSDRSSPTWVT